MPDEIPKPPVVVPNAASPASAASTPSQNVQSGPTINIGDEFGTAKRNLPPAATVLITLLGVLVVVAGISFLQRAKPQGSGSLDNIAAAEVPGQNVTLVALTFTIRNKSDKTIWIRSIQGKLKTASGELSGDALSAVDFERYYQAFPALKSGVQPPFTPETKLQPGDEVKGTVLVSFPVTLDVFSRRQSISLAIQPYDQPVPVVLSK
jgi:hypothetical protein